jgi:glycosyltransferase involved in cell wall biosynthesis
MEENLNLSASTEISINMETPYLFYPAQFWPHKNHINLLYALKILIDKYDLSFSLVFTGADKGNLKYVRERADDLGIVEKVHFLGFVSDEVLLSLYRKAFAMTFMSSFGPDNIPPLEAFSLGCPVIAARVHGSEEQLGKAALLVNPRDPEEIANAVRKLYSNPDLRDSLIREGYVKSEKWSTDDYVRTIFKIFDEFELIRRSWL